MATNDLTLNCDDLEAAYAAALAEYGTWDRRAVDLMSCDVAVAAQRSLEALRRLEARRDQALRRAAPRC